MFSASLLSSVHMLTFVSVASSIIDICATMVRIMHSKLADSRLQCLRILLQLHSYCGDVFKVYVYATS
jgi:hypothetical protein